MLAKVKVSRKDNSPALKQAIQQIAKSRVLVGIPQATASRPGDPINNAELLYIHTNGSAIKRIPARPVLEPALADKRNKALYTKPLQLAADAALAGDSAEMLRNLNLAGQQAANACQEWFTNPANGWAANAPATIKAKGSDRPLIDTGALRAAVTFVVESPQAPKQQPAKPEPLLKDEDQAQEEESE